MTSVMRDRRLEELKHEVLVLRGCLASAQCYECGTHVGEGARARCGELYCVRCYEEVWV